MYYTAQEIAEIAVRIEENGHDFYIAAAEMTENENVKKMFLGLAQKEESHIAAFKHLLSKVEFEHTEFDLESSGDYLQHQADTHIFQKKDSGKILAASITNSKEAIKIAHQFEIESVEFYTSLLKRVQSNAKNMVANIIEEEKQHAKELEAFL